MMKNFLVALALATPMLSLALGTESTPRANSQDSAFVTGKKAVEDKNWQVAIRAFNQVVKGDPRNADVHNYLGYVYRNVDQMDLSFKHYNEALQLDPNHRGANEYIGWAYLRMNKPAQAEEHLARLERICGKSCAEYQKLGRGIQDYKAKNK